MDRVFQMKKPRNVVQNILLPFLVSSLLMMFSIAMSIGTKPIKRMKEVYGVGGQAIQNNKPERMDRAMFFFIYL